MDINEKISELYSEGISFNRLLFEVLLTVKNAEIEGYDYTSYTITNYRYLPEYIDELIEELTSRNIKVSKIHLEGVAFDKTKLVMEW